MSELSGVRRGGPRSPQGHPRRQQLVQSTGQAALRAGEPASELVRVRTVLAAAEGPTTTRRRADRSTWSLVAGSLVVLFLLIGVGQLVGARLAERQALIDATRFTELVGGTFVDEETAQGLLDGDSSARARMDEIVRGRLVVNTSVRRVKVWSQEGRVLYSDDPSEIGGVYRLGGEKLATLHSARPTASVSELDDREDAKERLLDDRLLEVYTAIRTSSGEPLLFEAYLSYDRLRQQREAVFNTLGSLAALALVALAAVQLVLGLGHLRWLRRRHRAIAEQARTSRERDRRLLARNLHDGVIQELVGTAFVMDGATSALDAGDLQHAEALVAGAAASVRESVQALRSVIVDLYPRSIHQGGLSEALQDLAQPLRARGLDVSVVADNLPLDEDGDRELAEVVHRCAQELIRNVLRHADASAVEIRLELTGAWVMLTVRDDGRGLSADEVTAARDHLGLRALTDIVTERRGSLEICSAPGHGTEVRMGLRR